MKSISNIVLYSVLFVGCNGAENVETSEYTGTDFNSSSSTSLTSTVSSSTDSFSSTSSTFSNSQTTVDASYCSLLAANSYTRDYNTSSCTSEDSMFNFNKIDNWTLNIEYEYVNASYHSNTEYPGGTKLVHTFNGVTYNYYGICTITKNVVIYNNSNFPVGTGYCSNISGETELSIYANYTIVKKGSVTYNSCSLNYTYSCQKPINSDKYSSDLSFTVQ